MAMPDQAGDLRPALGAERLVLVGASALNRDQEGEPTIHRVTMSTRIG
jgi:hypothetical protein